jgi:hypothetical protein
VHAGGTEGAILLVVVKAPDILDGFRLRFKLEGRKLLGKKEIVEFAEEGFVERLLEALFCEEQVQFWLFARGRIRLF